MIELNVLKNEDTKKVLKMKDVINAVEEAYASHANGNAGIYPLITDVFEEDKAEMDIKSGWLRKRGVFGLKVVSWFEENEKKGLPALMGEILVMDINTGAPKGIVDGGYITGMRTGACGAIGAKYLARMDSNNLLVVGAGVVAFYQVAATLVLFPEIKNVMVYDGLSFEYAKKFVSGIEERLREFGVCDFKANFAAVENIEKATGMADIIITCTPSRTPIIKKNWVRPGTHFSCIGSDMEGKEEIDPEIFDSARVFVDDIEQCVNVGEIEIPIKKGILSKENIAGKIGDAITGNVVGRNNDDEITVFDATGIALLDLVSAELALAEAKKMGLGNVVEL